MIAPASLQLADNSGHVPAACSGWWGAPPHPSPAVIHVVSGGCGWAPGTEPIPHGMVPWGRCSQQPWGLSGLGGC